MTGVQIIKDPVSLCIHVVFFWYIWTWMNGWMDGQSVWIS